MTKHDQKMYQRGYRWKLIDKGEDPIAPLYARTTQEVGPLFREWPKRKFIVVPLENWECVRPLFEFWKNGNEETVIAILATEPPYLTATFLDLGFDECVFGVGAIKRIVVQLREIHRRIDTL